MQTVEAVDWLYKKGLQDLDEHKLDQARQRFGKILAMTRKSEYVERANYGLARVYLGEGNYFWAMDHIRRALKRNPNSAEYRYLKGRIHQFRKEYQKAAAEALKAVEDDLENGRYYHLLGVAVYHCEGYQAARRFLRWAIECDPGRVEPRLDLARIEISESHYQRALQLLKGALQETTEPEKIREAIRAIQENWKLCGTTAGNSG